MFSTAAALAEHRYRPHENSMLSAGATMSSSSAFNSTNDSTLSSDESTFKTRNFITSRSAAGSASSSNESSNDIYESLTTESSSSGESKVSSSSSSSAALSKTGSEHLYDTEYASVDLDLSRIDIPKQDIKTVKIDKTPAKNVEPPLTFSQLMKQLGLVKSSKSKETSAAEVAEIESIVEKVKEAQIIQRQKLFKRYFIGCKTNDQAKDAVYKPTSFRIYYKMPQDLDQLIEDVQENGNDTYLRESLPLYIVYHRSDGIYDHYKVKCFEDDVDGSSLYQVQYGSPKAPKFRSVERLLKYYQNNIAIRSTRYGIEDEVDVFPYWKKKQ